MEKNNIKSKGMRTLTQEELNHISGGFWGWVIPFAAMAIEAAIVVIKHKKDPLGKHDD